MIEVQDSKGKFCGCVLAQVTTIAEDLVRIFQTLKVVIK